MLLHNFENESWRGDFADPKGMLKVEFKKWNSLIFSLLCNICNGYSVETEEMVQAQSAHFIKKGAGKRQNQGRAEIGTRGGKTTRQRYQTTGQRYQTTGRRYQTTGQKGNPETNKVPGRSKRLVKNTKARG